MGFFSYKCLGCDHPMLGPMATNKTNYWMSQVIAVFPNDKTWKGSTWEGQYDGYGRIGNLKLPYPLPCACWHRACWEKASRPKFEKVSDNADDQGWFFDEGEHDLPKPEIPALVRAQDRWKRK